MLLVIGLGRCYQSIPRPGHHAEEIHAADGSPLMVGLRLRGLEHRQEPLVVRFQIEVRRRSL